MRVALVADETSRPFEPWTDSAIPVAQQIRGLYGARLWERDVAETATFLEKTLGFEKLGHDDGWTRYGFRNAAGIVDLRESPSERRGRWGVGAIHHLAWRVDDEEHQLAVRAQVEKAGPNATPVIDRFWFKSVYFKEPGGVLFELATDGPGFAVDEDRRAPRRVARPAAVPAAAPRRDFGGAAGHHRAGIQVESDVRGAHAHDVSRRPPDRRSRTAASCGAC